MRALVLPECLGGKDRIRYAGLPSHGVEAVLRSALSQSGNPVPAVVTDLILGLTSREVSRVDAGKLTNMRRHKEIDATSSVGCFVAAD